MYRDQGVYFISLLLLYTVLETQKYNSRQTLPLRIQLLNLRIARSKTAAGHLVLDSFKFKKVPPLFPSGYESQLLVTFLRHDAILSCCTFITQKLKHWDQVRKSEQLHRTFLGFFSHMIMSLSCPLTLLTQAGQWLRITNPIQFRQLGNFTRFVSSANS